MHEQSVKRQADEKRRNERRQRHLQDDLRYALKKMPEPIDVNLPYEEVSVATAFIKTGLTVLLGGAVNSRAPRV